MPDQIVKKILKLDRKDISYIKFLFEGYEDLCTITTVDKNEAVIALTILPDFVSDVNRILDALREEVDFQEIVLERTLSGYTKGQNGNEGII